MRRNLLVGGVVGGMVLTAAVGWALGSQIRSPAELAAAAAPPTASNITVEVVRQVLSADIITRGEVVYDEPVQISLSGSFHEQPENLVVTAAVEVDAELAEGDLAVEVVGRPVFLLQGEIPAFRDLRPGATGVDVLQLEQALERLGFFADTPDETFDAATSAALEAWYQDRGYPANGSSTDEEAALQAARQRVRAAEAAMKDLEGGNGEDGSRSALLQARSEVDASVAALELARLDATNANAQAERAVKAASSDRDDAAARLKRAEGGKHPDTGQRPSAAEVSQLRRELREAEAMLGDATFERERTALEQSSMVAQAKDRVAIARASVDELGRIPSGSDGDLEFAEEELVSARQELEGLEATLGTWLPAGEFVFLPSLPVRVDQVSVARGSPIDGSFLTVSGSDLALRTSVPQRDAPLVSVGMPVEIENPEGDAPIAGIITEVADRAGTHNLAGDRVYVEVAPEELPSELIGQNVRVTIPVSSTGGEVLAVPAAALSATATGRTIVQVEDLDGTLRTVTVEAGLATGGLVEVTPVDGQLDAGDLVVVGREDGSPLDIDDVGTDPDDVVDDAPSDDADEPDVEPDVEPDDIDGSDGSAEG